MFAQLNTTAEAGDAYDAVDRIVIETPSDGNPAVNLALAKRIVLDGTTHTLKRTLVIEPIILQETPDGPPANLTEAVTILDPTTGTATGQTMTYGELMGAVYSFVAHVLAKQ